MGNQFYKKPCFVFDAAYSKKDAIEKKEGKICTEKPAICLWNFIISFVTYRPLNQVGRVCDIVLWQKRPNEENNTWNIPISLLFRRVLGKREKSGILHLQKPPVKRNSTF